MFYQSDSLEYMQGKIVELLSEKYSDREYPACRWLAEKWAETLPLKALKILDATPVYFNTLAKYLPLLAAGAELTVGFSKEIGYDRQMLRLLDELHISTLFFEAEEKNNSFDIILDCAAVFADWHASVGYVELTRSGVDRYRSSQLPVFVADSGRIKQIETCLGTGESYYRAMNRCGYSDWKGRQIVIFGSGKVGTGLITYAYRKGAVVTVVTDPEQVRTFARPYIHTLIDFRDAEAVNDAIVKADAVVTSTGVPGALANVPPEIWERSHALLANMGVRDEYGAGVSENRVLCGKKTLNFMLDEPTRLRYIDATFALHNVGAHYLLEHRDECGLIIPPVSIEQEILDVTRRAGLITEELDWIAL